MSKTVFRLTPLVMLGLWLGSGCVPPLYYKDMVAPVGYQGTGAVAVTVQDQREYIKSGKTEPSYEGQVRATVGIPYHRNTVTGGPLATEMARGLAATLKARGYQTTVLGAAPDDTLTVVTERLVNAGAARALYLSIDEWMYDGWGSYTLEIKLTLRVMDGGGKVLAETTDQIKENLGSHPMNPAKEAYRRALERLLNNEDVVKAMSAPAVPAPTATEPPASSDPAPPANDKSGEAGEPPPVPAEDQTPAETTPASPAEG